MIEFRDETARRPHLDLITHINQDGLDRGVDPFVSGSALHTHVMKTQGLIQALDKYGFDAAIGGARRDEEKSRAKERIFSFRSKGHVWDPRNQRPELWNLFNTRILWVNPFACFRCRTGQSSMYGNISAENIAMVPLYFAKMRPVVHRSGTWIMVDDDRFPLEPGEKPELRLVRFRTLGCYPLSGAVESSRLHAR